MESFPTGTFFLALAFLLGATLVTAFTTAITLLGKLRTSEEFQKLKHLFFFGHFLRPLFKERKWEGLLFTLSFSKHVLHLCYGITALFFLIASSPRPKEIVLDSLWIVVLGVLIIIVSILVELLARFVTSLKPLSMLKVTAVIVSLILLIFSPITTLFLRTMKAFFPSLYREKGTVVSFKIKDKLLEFLYETEQTTRLDPNDKKLILSIASFKDKIAREVMVPRIDVFCLPADTSIEEAAQKFVKEGYSRIPIYKENVDHIVGVLLHKDILKALVTHQHNLKAPIETLLKPVLYTPETKKISNLLQEFRSKKIHLAIVVDEYGGTEGIVTIEDILEELVGEIADEYDFDQEVLYTALAGGGWIVDAKMGISDIERELGIKIPEGPDYETIGGYVFQRAGSIPSKGWRIHHDEFDLEILSSDERSIEKIKIIPLSQ